MPKPSMNLQDSFLNHVRKDGSEIKVVMIDGSQLVGVVRGFDNFTVIVQSKGMQHLLYKHAIAQVVARRVGKRDDGQQRRRESHGPARESSPKESSPKESLPKPQASPPEAKQPFNSIQIPAAASGEPAAGKS